MALLAMGNSAGAISSFVALGVLSFAVITVVQFRTWLLSSYGTPPPSPTPHDPPPPYRASWRRSFRRYLDSRRSRNPARIHSPSAHERSALDLARPSNALFTSEGMGVGVRADEVDGRGFHSHEDEEIPPSYEEALRNSVENLS
ncbi:uncharacterized protein LOC122257469 isoform X2 [Penaeus japonicus]|nr:uncharacterized protein LOC122257469 isoform X2 [Penaeus japonicus]XP_042878697.1 uncharacterized protein LOC122257469 isoform X2 [Penaeus japonicus]